MLGKKLLSWMDEHERTPGYLCRKSGLALDELIALITGDALPTDANLTTLAEATGLPREQMESNVGDLEAGQPATDPLHCLTVKEVAALMHVSEDTVRWEMDEGVLGHITVGQRAKRVPRAALEQRLSEWRTKSEGGMGWH